MGDAGPFPAESHLQDHDPTSSFDDDPSTTPREIHVLVTGFGPFRSFLVNPSWLIAADLPRHVDPEYAPAHSVPKQHAEEQAPADEAQWHSDASPGAPYKIIVHTYPTAIRVSYNLVHGLIPQLVADPRPESQSEPHPPSALHADHSPSSFPPPPHGYDFVLHIGLAAGRDNYTLETQAHRDHYKLKDTEDTDGRAGETVWRHRGMPELLDVGWHKEDVLARWEALVRRREDDYEHAEMARAGWRDGPAGTSLVETARLRARVFLGKGKRAVVKLSRDAGRYLCEYIFYAGLGTRWCEANVDEHAGEEERARARDKVGKVAFLHVPGGTSKYDVARGVRVAESAILALVRSWEAGFRNPDVHGDVQTKEAGQSRQHARDVGVSSGMYESKGTGDQ